MARVSFIQIAFSGVAALSFAGLTVPSSDRELSTQRSGGTAAAEESYKQFSNEGRALSREFDAIAFQERSLQSAQAGLAAPQKDVTKQISSLEQLNKQLQDRIAARDARTQKFHRDMLAAPYLSEADLNEIYTGPVKGTYYAHYYAETMAYRDECKRDTTCMMRMETNESITSAKAHGSRAAGFFIGSLLGFFGLAAASSAAGTAANTVRRRRDEKQRRQTENQHRERLASMRDMLTPKKR